jgi:hypothetical protein
MSTSHTQPAQRRARRLIAIIGTLIVFAVLGAALGMGAGSADAYVVHKSGAYPGSATIPAVLVTGPRSSCTATGCTIDLSKGYFTNQARRVNENPTYASSWQWVCVTHRLWQYHSRTFTTEPSWTIAKRSTASCGYISPSATSINTPAYSFAIDSLDSNMYATDVKITWQLPSGYLLGTKIYDYNAASDYSIDYANLGPLATGYAENGDFWVWLT